MFREGTKFIDLDMMVQTVLDEGDRNLFEEAVQCYQIGSHRAAVILTWCATADCLKRRLHDLATEGDAQALQSQNELKAVDGQACYEENLIAAAGKCELIDDFEEKSLRFARDTRTRCAHPTGVIPSAEAVRHIFHICIKAVLSRKGFRGMSFVRDVVTVQFDDRYFLPNNSKASEHCRAIVDKVPKRTWPQFVRIATQERPGPHSEVWQNNALVFFRVLLSLSDDLTARHIAAGFQGFEARAVDLFATLVGIDHRATIFWDDQKRAQARARLQAASAVRITLEQVHSWAVICSADGFDDADRDLLRERWGGISRHLAGEEEFLQRRRAELLNLLRDMLLNESTSLQGVIVLSNLLGSRLFDEQSDPMQVIVETIIERFARDQRYRELMNKVAIWTGAMLVKLLELTELFLAECSDDEPDDVLFILEAARELAHRSPGEIPCAFADVVNRVLRKELYAEWADEGSAVGEAFRRQLALLLQQEKAAFSGIDGTLVTVNLGDVNGMELSDDSSEPTLDDGKSAEPNAAIEENT